MIEKPYSSYFTTITVLMSNFTGNKAEYNGGALYTSGDSFFLREINFKSNSAMVGGCIYSHHIGRISFDILIEQIDQFSLTGFG